MKKILIIEDEQPVRTGIRDLLELKEYDTYSADCGSDGIKLAKQILPDLILCDILMPEIDGYEVLKQLNRDEATAVIPFIFLTAKSEMNDLRKGMDSGADDYLIKPFTSDTLYKAIEARLDRKEKYAHGLQPFKSSHVHEDTNAKNHLVEHLFITEGNKPQFIKINDIECIAAFNEYTNIYMINNKKLVIRKSLREWESMLPNDKFIRIHRSTIINFDYVDRVEKFYNRSYVVYLKNIKQPFTISQRYFSKLKNLGG